MKNDWMKAIIEEATKNEKQLRKKSIIELSQSISASTRSASRFSRRRIRWSTLES